MSETISNSQEDKFPRIVTTFKTIKNYNCRIVETREGVYYIEYLGDHDSMKNEIWFNYPIEKYNSDFINDLINSLRYKITGTISID